MLQLIRKIFGLNKLAPHQYEDKEMNRKERRKGMNEDYKAHKKHFKNRK